MDLAIIQQRDPIPQSLRTTERFSGFSGQQAKSDRSSQAVTVKLAAQRSQSQPIQALYDF